MAEPNHITREYQGVVLERMKHLSPGGKMADLPFHLQHESFRKGKKKTGGPNMRLIRLKMDEPSLTVTAYIFNKFVHPTENRYITPREAACLQDFPIDYKFEGTLSQVQKQIGNAVPIKMANAIAKEVAKYFISCSKLGNIYIYSYFTGAGGLDLGFEQASNESVKFHTIFSTDIESCIENTIKTNRPHWNFLRANIQDLSPEKILKNSAFRPDIIIGGPPCQPFSVAGKQKATKDPIGLLYKDYVRHIAFLKPDMVIMENVYSLAQVKSTNMLERIYSAFDKIGYTIIHKELMAANYGTPQKRRRLFFVAARNIHKFNFPLPTHDADGNLFGMHKYNGAGNSFLKLSEPEKHVHAAFPFFAKSTQDI